MLIEGTGNEGGYLRLQGKWPLLRFMSSVAPSGKKGFAFQNDGAGRLVLGNLGDDLGWKNATSARVMTWTSDGNVGVGTVDPTEKLEVNGNVKTTGILTAGKVQIVDVVVENTDCAPMGLVARDNTGILLSCQGSPLKWKKASGGGGEKRQWYDATAAGPGVFTNNYGHEIIVVMRGYGAGASQCYIGVTKGYPTMTPPHPKWGSGNGDYVDVSSNFVNGAGILCESRAEVPAGEQWNMAVVGGGSFSGAAIVR
jgi:hypothetical protein